jgi:hypothetical protein
MMVKEIPEIDSHSPTNGDKGKQSDIFGTHDT